MQKYAVGEPALEVLGADDLVVQRQYFSQLFPRIGRLGLDDDALFPEQLLAEGFRRAVLELLVRVQALSGEMRDCILGWRRSGLSAHNQVRVGETDAEGRRKFAGCMLRALMSLEKMSYDAKTGTVIYRSKMHLWL